MITNFTNFKMFESEENGVTFVIDDLIDYAKERPFLKPTKSVIYEFLQKLLLSNNIIVNFYCKHCTKDINGATNYLHSNKIHKGKIRGFGSGVTTEFENNIYLSIDLKRIKYSHEVDTSQPITIYGKISENLKKIIDEINMKRMSNKYNL